MQKSWLLLFFFLTFTAKAQEIYSLKNDLSIEIDGKTLASPFAGGINSAQIQSIDLNADGQEEWVVWDINSRQLQIFEKSSNQFTHLPELSYLFPSDIAGFLVLADYDGDGKKDLFTATALGIKVYRNTSQGTRISWALSQNFLKLDGSGNIQVNNLDTPLIQDLDGDGDLDLVIFNFAAGDYLEFYKNTSMERKGIPDMDGFEFPNRFWGNFVFCGCGEFAFGQTCTGAPISANARKETNQRIQHAGGHSILYRDFNGDGLSDLVLGRDECSSLYFLLNKGTESVPLFNSFEKSLPGFGAFPEFPRFHVGQLIQDQFIISINTNEAASNYAIDFEQSIVDFKANENSEFGYLQKDMLDLGENSRPFFKGNKNGGELILCTNVTTNQKVQAQLSRFSLVNGIFKLLDRNYLNLAAQDLLDVQYLEFQDSQNRTFRLISGVSAANNTRIQQLFKLEGESLELLNLSGYEIKLGDYLQFFKTSENKDFLLVARQNGGLDLYQINFNLSQATLLEKDFLGFQDNPSNRNLTIAVSGQTQPDLFTVDQNGKILKIADFMNVATRSAVLLEIGNQNLESRLGRNTWIAPINPLFEESPDLMLGTRAGGLIYLKSKGISNPSEGKYQVKVYPNPSNGPIKVISNLPAVGRLINTMGQILLDQIAIPANQEVVIQAQGLNSGLYFLQLETEDRKVLVKKVLVR